MGGLSTAENAPRRLSKPRTNTSSTNLLSSVSSDQHTESTSSPLQSSDLDYFGDHAAVVTSQGERRSRRKSRSKIRAYLYGSNNEATQHSSDEDESHSTSGGTTRNIRKRMSRKGSSVMQIQSAKTSSAYLPKSESQGSDPEESAMIASQIKERVYYDSLAAQNHVASPVDDDKHPDSVTAPLRRKSLYTPGIATRNASDILRKPPPPDNVQSQNDRDYYYNPARPENSPLGQLAALNISDDGRATPSSIHYAQIGELQLGTLRITNGIPRHDTPDLLARPSTPDLKTQEEYYTTSEGCLTAKLSDAFSHPAQNSLKIETGNQQSHQSDDENNNNPQDSSALRKETTDPAVSMARQYIAELLGSPFSEPERAIPCCDQDQYKPPDDEGIVMTRADGSSADLWHRLIDEADVQKDDSCTREDAFRKLIGNTPSVLESQRLTDPSSIASRYVVSTEVPKTDSGYSSNSSLHASNMTASGASGNTETPDFQSGTLPNKSRAVSGPLEVPRPESIAKQGDYFSQPVGVAPIPYSFNVLPRHALETSSPSSQRVRPSARSSARPSSQNIVRKLQKPRPKSQPPPVNMITVQGCRDLGHVEIPRVPSVIAARHADRLRQFPLLDHTFPSSQHTTIDEGNSPSEFYHTPIRFPSPANAPEAATENIVTVSLNADGKLIDRPRPSLKDRGSIMVNEFVRRPSDIVRSPSWSDFGDGRKRKGQRKQDLEKQFQKDGKKQRSGRSRSSSRVDSSHRQPSQQETLATIADFGTVTESLGGDPYDITTAMFSKASQKAGHTCPHQISTAMTRPKSMVGMNEMATAEAGRAPSRARSQSLSRSSRAHKDLSIGETIPRMRLRPRSMLVNDIPPIPALAAVDIRAHDLEWARHRQRSQSFAGAKVPTGGQFNDRGGIPGRSFRPSSITVDVPPVPALPSSQEIKQWEAQNTRSRPQSMIIGAKPTPPAALHEVQRTDTLNDAVALSRPSTSTPPRNLTTKKLVPDLWSNGSLERKNPKAVERLQVDQSNDDTSSTGEKPEKGCPEPVERLQVDHSGNDTSLNGDQPIEANTVWEAQRQLWAQRRKSAGEALLRNRISQILNDRSAESKGQPMTQQDEDERSRAVNKALTAKPQFSEEAKQIRRPGPSLLGPMPRPLGSHPQLSPQQQFYEPEYNPSPYISFTSNPYHEPPPVVQPQREPPAAPVTKLQRKPPPPPVPKTEIPTLVVRCVQPQSYTATRKRVGSGSAISTPTTAFESLTGRYVGGLMYGYEPGHGLGGSAGTRSAKTEASRKSVDVSKGFGIDLSDVPIFVAPTTAK